MLNLNPFNAAYAWANTSENMVLVDTTLSVKNLGFNGNTFQEATSVVTTTSASTIQGTFPFAS